MIDDDSIEKISEKIDAILLIIVGIGLFVVMIGLLFRQVKTDNIIKIDNTTNYTTRQYMVRSHVYGIDLPSNPTIGMEWYDSRLGMFRCYNSNIGFVREGGK